MNSTTSETVQYEGITSCCGTYDVMRENCRFRGRPFRKTSPLCGPVFFPAMMSRSVVLPHPLGPISATMLPEANTPLIGDRIVFLSFSPVRPLRTAISKQMSRKAR